MFKLIGYTIAVLAFVFIVLPALNTFFSIVGAVSGVL